MLGRLFIEFLLPHRDPFLMVDSIVEYIGGDTPSLRAELLIRGVEPVFAESEGPLKWPPAYVIEGLGQCCNLVSHISKCEFAYLAKGLDSKSFVTELMTLDNGSESIIKRFFGKDVLKPITSIGLLAFLDVEISSCVSSGELLSYGVQLTRTYKELSHFNVSALVGKRSVLQGTFAGALNNVTDS